MGSWWGIRALVEVFTLILPRLELPLSQYEFEPLLVGDITFLLAGEYPFSIACKEVFF